MSIQFTVKGVAGGSSLRYEARFNCAHCNTVNKMLLFCSRCKQATYCNKTCQRAHWKNGHKHHCDPIPTVPLKHCGEHVTCSEHTSFTGPVDQAYQIAEKEKYIYTSLLLPVRFTTPMIKQRQHTLREQCRVYIEELEVRTKLKEGDDILQELKEVMGLLSQVETIK